MEPLSGHKKIVPGPHGAYLRHLAVHMGGGEGRAEGTGGLQAVGCSGEQHRAKDIPMATNTFQAPQALQDGTGQQTGTLDLQVPQDSARKHPVTSPLLPSVHLAHPILSACG